MLRDKQYYVYMLTNPSQHPFYTGVTGHLRRRIEQHKDPYFGGYTIKYKLFRLVYYEKFLDIRNAINYEKKLKKLSRPKKIALIRSLNPNFDDLGRDWVKT